jgi:hypothetical protein
MTNKNEEIIEKLERERFRGVRKQNKIGKWSPLSISQVKLQRFYDWINKWGDYDKYSQYIPELERTNYKRGYQQAINDIYIYLKINFKRFDKRTKTGYTKK